MPQPIQNRRAEPRALTAALIRLTDQHADTPAVLEDLSPSGASVYIDRELEIGAEVFLSVGQITCTGTVKHREPLDEGFLVGIQFRDGKWPGPIRFPIHPLSD